MRQRTFFFQGTARNIGKFGFLNPGDKVTVPDDDYALAMEQDTALWLEKPTDRDSVLRGDLGSGVQTKSANYNVLTTDRLIKADTNAAAGAFALTFPANPAARQIVEVLDTTGAAATKNVTINRNGKLIDGAAANAVINTNGGSKRLFYDGAGWQSF